MTDIALTTTAALSLAVLLYLLARIPLDWIRGRGFWAPRGPSLLQTAWPHWQLNQYLQEKNRQRFVDDCQPETLLSEVEAKYQKLMDEKFWPEADHPKEPWMQYLRDLSGAIRFKHGMLSYACDWPPTSNVSLACRRGG